MCVRERERVKEFHAMEISRIATELMAPVVPNAAKMYTGMRLRERER